MSNYDSQHTTSSMCRAFSCREIYKPKLKRKSDLLINPTLDESIYLRLKALKGSNAAKANIDPTEKAYRKLSFKVLDLVKSLLFLAGRLNLRSRSRWPLDYGPFSFATSSSLVATTFSLRYTPSL